jgi:hypothetical protein
MKQTIDILNEFSDSFDEFSWKIKDEDGIKLLPTAYKALGYIQPFSGQGISTDKTKPLENPSHTISCTLDLNIKIQDIVFIYDDSIKYEVIKVDKIRHANYQVISLKKSNSSL